MSKGAELAYRFAIIVACVLWIATLKQLRKEQTARREFAEFLARIAWVEMDFGRAPQRIRSFRITADDPLEAYTVWREFDHHGLQDYGRFNAPLLPTVRVLE